MRAEEELGRLSGRKYLRTSYFFVVRFDDSGIQVETRISAGSSLALSLGVQTACFNSKRT